VHAAHAHEHDGHACDDPAHDHSHEHENGHHHHHDEALPHAASTFFLPLAEPVEREAFERFLGTLPPSVFRAKGFVRLANVPGQIHTFQKVRDQAELLLLPLEGMDDVATGLIFIGPHLEEGKIRELAEGLATRRVATS
jgi:G3E family GTPase